MPLQRFDPPAFLNDFQDTLLQKWSDNIHSWIEGERAHLPSNYAKFFFNELQHPEAENGNIANIVWEGFPRKWKLQHPNDEVKKWTAAEELYQDGDGNIFRDQDEYLEWRAFRSNSKLEKIVFTCEAPEYWDFIAKNDEQLLLSLYRKYVSPAVNLTDLFRGSGVGKIYNGYNKWNTTHGIVHLTQGANTLRAEIDLAAKATVLRKNATADPITDTIDLICCSGYGAVERFSDPTIGAAVNGLVRSGLSATLRNPIALYISKIKTAGIEVPAPFQVKDFWKVIRGNKQEGMILRAEFSAPENSNISLESIKVGGKPLEFGGQLAEMIEMVIYGKAFKLENTRPATEGCVSSCDGPQNVIQPLNAVEAIIKIKKSNTTNALRLKG